MAVPIDEWLVRNKLPAGDLANRLRYNGFDTAALAGLMTEDDMNDMAIEDLHNGYVLAQDLKVAVNVQKLKSAALPTDDEWENVTKWLDRLGLLIYQTHFEWFGFK